VLVQSHCDCFPIKEEELDSERQIFDDSLILHVGLTLMIHKLMEATMRDF
jgi:hypothetical protein